MATWLRHRPVAPYHCTHRRLSRVGHMQGESCTCRASRRSKLRTTCYSCRSRAWVVSHTAASASSPRLISTITPSPHSSCPAQSRSPFRPMPVYTTIRCQCTTKEVPRGSTFMLGLGRAFLPIICGYDRKSDPTLWLEPSGWYLILGAPGAKLIFPGVYRTLERLTSGRDTVRACRGLSSAAPSARRR